MSDLENPQGISYLVFFCTLVIVLLTIIPVIFPALFSSFFGMFAENLDPFELGHQSILLIVSNAIIFSFGIVYYKNKIPSSIHDIFEKIRTFEISKRVALISLIIILGIYIGLTAPELSLDESTNWSDYNAVLIPALEIWPFGEAADIYVQEQNDRYVRMFLLDISLDIFQNIKLLPFVASILVVCFTYLVTTQFCQNVLLE